MATEPLHEVRLPNEPASYRKARDKLLLAELKLRRQVEAVAELRRKLAEGGEVPEDYVFEEGPADLADDVTVRQVKLSELFAGKKSLLLYSYMYGPKAKQPCPMCTCLLDSLNGAAPHINQRASFAVVAKSPIARLRRFARERGWTGLRLLSSAGNGYNRDYMGEDAKENQWPVLNVFVKRNGKIRHFWHSELLYAGSDAGQNPRHVDMIWPLWNMLDFTPEGRGKAWYPSLKY